ncbi:MFS transporter [Ectobacillus funiculus]|uniref:MFS transporter n=1 Tax=Ectobacillus funiculus TaxID=137993 RepID=UPI00397A95D1
MSTKAVNKKTSFIPKAPALSWWALLLLWAVFAMNAIDREMMFRVMPAIVEEYNIGADTVGTVTALIMFSTGILAAVGMSWSDRGGKGWARKYRHLPIVVAYTLFSILTGVGFLTAGIMGFMILQVLKNAAGGLGEGIEVTSVAEWWPKEARGFALGAHHAGYPWGALIGGLIITAILSVTGDDWRMVFLLIPLLMIPIFTAYWMFARPSRFKKYQEKALEMGLTPTIDEGEANEVNRKGAVIDSLKNPNILVGAICCCLGIAVFTGINFWLAPYLTFVADFTITEAAGWSVIFTITGGIGQIFWGTLSDKIGRKITLLICFAWLAVSFWLFQFVASGLTALILIQLFAGCATNAIFPVLYSLVTDSAKKGYIGTANGIALTGLYTGGLSPFVLGLLIQAGGGWNSSSGYMSGLYFMIACMILAFFLILFFTRETVGAKRGRDFSLVSKESCNIYDNTVQNDKSSISV